MTKDVLISVTGSHRTEGDDDNISVITAGNYYFKNGKHYIIYEEHIEGVAEPIQNTIKIGTDSVEMIKGGEARTHMIFEMQKVNMTCYATPYGQMMMGVATDQIQIREFPDQIRVSIDYSLEINYEKASECHVEIEVNSKATAKLKLGKES